VKPSLPTPDKLFGDFHVIAKSSQEKVATYLKEYKHGLALVPAPLGPCSRTGCGTQAQSCMGLFINYDAKKKL
jgi:hypothetical protein